MKECVAVAIVRADGAVVGQHRDNRPDIAGPDTWVIPGGAVEEGETQEYAAFREIEEETGYTPHLLELLVEDVYTAERGVQVRRRIYWEPYDGVQQIETREGQEIRFVAPSEFGKLNFYIGHQEFFRLASEKVLRVGSR